MNYQETDVIVAWDIDQEEPVLLGRPGERSQPTGIEPKGEIVNLPLVIEYPDDYTPVFSGLLGESIFNREGEVVVQRFPRADFSEEKMRREATRITRSRAYGLLAKTDAFVLRNAVEGDELPEEISDLRARIRKAEEEDLEWLDGLDDEDLSEFDTFALKLVGENVDFIVQDVLAEMRLT